MTRQEAILELACLFTNGFWLTRKQIMESVGFCSDVTHLVEGLRQVGFLIVVKKGANGAMTEWGLPKPLIAEYMADPFAFRSKYADLRVKRRKKVAKRSVLRIRNEFGEQFITNSISS